MLWLSELAGYDLWTQGWTLCPLNGFPNPVNSKQKHSGLCKHCHISPIVFSYLLFWIPLRSCRVKRIVWIRSEKFLWYVSRRRNRVIHFFWLPLKNNIGKLEIYSRSLATVYFFAFPQHIFFKTSVFWHKEYWDLLSKYQARYQQVSCTAFSNSQPPRFQDGGDGSPSFHLFVNGKEFKYISFPYDNQEKAKLLVWFWVFRSPNEIEANRASCK